SYHDLPYQSSNPAGLMNQASINPINILDDGDDSFPPPKQRRDMATGPAVAGAAAGSAGFLGGLFGRKAKNHTSSGTYNAIDGAPQPEKSEWLAEQTRGKRKMKLWVGVAIGLVIVLAIVGGIVGGVLSN